MVILLPFFKQIIRLWEAYMLAVTHEMPMLDPEFWLFLVRVILNKCFQTFEGLSTEPCGAFINAGWHCHKEHCLSITMLHINNFFFLDSSNLAQLIYSTVICSVCAVLQDFLEASNGIECSSPLFGKPVWSRAVANFTPNASNSWSCTNFMEWRLEGVSTIYL